MNYTDPDTGETGFSSANSDILTGVYRWDTKSYKSGKRVYLANSGFNLTFDSLQPPVARNFFREPTRTSILAVSKRLPRKPMRMVDLSKYGISGTALKLPPCKLFL